MKKVLITGANSYVGTSVQKYLEALDYEVVVLDMIDNAWREFDFTSYDSIFHVAGIVHGKNCSELYYKVNRDLALEAAAKAKAAKVKQFVFMSSMSVYGSVKDKEITVDTKIRVKGDYGKSKMQAEEGLQKMDSKDFSVVIIRPPMIFGKDCTGNFTRLKKLAIKLPIFPKIKNQRSMLYIDNLSSLVELIIRNNAAGMFFPQNKDYFCTSEIVKSIATLNNKKIKLTKLFNWCVWLFFPFISQLRKLFGSLTYSKDLSNHFDGAYQIKNNEESLIES